MRSSRVIRCSCCVPSVLVFTEPLTLVYRMIGWYPRGRTGIGFQTVKLKKTDGKPIPLRLVDGHLIAGYISTEAWWNAECLPDA